MRDKGGRIDVREKDFYILDNRRNKRYFYNRKTKTRTGDGSPVDMSNHIQ